MRARDWERDERALSHNLSRFLQFSSEPHEPGVVVKTETSAPTTRYSWQQASKVPNHMIMRLFMFCDPPCSVDSAEFPYIVLKTLAKLAYFFDW